jgi:hypothetical protein
MNADYGGCYRGRNIARFIRVTRVSKRKFFRRPVVLVRRLQYDQDG